MKKKVENPSSYWSDFEGELSVYGYLKWQRFDSMLENVTSFTWDYINLSKKFGIALPVRTFQSRFDFETEYLDYKVKFQDKRQHNPMFFIQNHGDNWLFPSVLFVSEKDEPKKVVCIEPLTEFEEVNGKRISNSSSMPLRVSLDIGTNGIQLSYYLDNDIFNSWIDNKKTKRDPNIGGKGFILDNSELAYLNTPRLNSFLRDLKALCFKYGATEFEFEDLGLNDFCEDGVMFDGEVVYYEDIVELLAPEHRIVSM